MLGQDLRLAICCLPEQEYSKLTKVYHLQSAAHEIWKRLAEEYGAISALNRAQASAAFYALQKQPSMTMQQHINAFYKIAARSQLPSQFTAPKRRCQPPIPLISWATLADISAIDGTTP